jgi:hypothetical protein
MVALIELGRLDEAFVVAEGARDLASGPYREWTAMFDAPRASLLVSSGRPAEAEEVLRSIPWDG